LELLSRTGPYKNIKGKKTINPDTNVQILLTDICTTSLVGHTSSPKLPFWGTRPKKEYWSIVTRVLPVDGMP